MQWVCRRVWDRDPWVPSVCVCVPRFFTLVALRCSERACKGACVATACHATHEWAVCEWVRGVCVLERCTWGAHGGCVGCSRVCKHARCIHQSACARGGMQYPPHPLLSIRGAAPTRVRGVAWGRKGGCGALGGARKGSGGEAHAWVRREKSGVCVWGGK